MLTTIEIIPCHDPAIDLTRSDLAAYLQDRDIARLVLFDGMRAERWWIRPLTLGERRALRSLSTDEDRYEGAFVRAAMRGEWRDQRGEWRTWVRASDRPMPDDVLAEIPEASVQDVGMVALAKSILPFGAHVPWPPPRGSQAALTARLLPHAGRLTAHARPNNDGHGEPPQGPSRPPYGLPGAVTAAVAPTPTAGPQTST